MKQRARRNWQSRILPAVAVVLLLAGACAWFLVLKDPDQPLWKTVRKESRRILGQGDEGISPQERRIREEVVLKKMEEVTAQKDWRDLAPEYPRPGKLESPDSKARLEAFKSSPRMKDMEKELKEELKKKEDLFNPELPTPSSKEVVDVSRLKDKGTEEVIRRLLSSKDRSPADIPLEENVQLGIKGPLVSRKILERPQPPQVRVRVEAEIELTVWVLPSGAVDRAIPSVKGDAELERTAIQYLRQWRFAPLYQEEPQVEQWGTIPLKFKLR